MYTKPLHLQLCGSLNLFFYICFIHNLNYLYHKYYHQRSLHVKFLKCECNCDWLWLWNNTSSFLFHSSCWILWEAKSTHAIARSFWISWLIHAVFFIIQVRMKLAVFPFVLAVWWLKDIVFYVCCCVARLEDSSRQSAEKPTNAALPVCLLVFGILKTGMKRVS